MVPKNNILEKINLAKVTHSEKLNLRYLGITVLPEEISELVNLESLDLRRNKLTNIDRLKTLVKLKHLDIRGNNIAKLPSFLIDLGIPILWDSDDKDDKIYVAGNPLVFPPKEIIYSGVKEIINYFNRFTPCICELCLENTNPYIFDLKEISNFSGNETVKCGTSYTKIDISQLMININSQNNNNTKNVFLSYASEDKKLVEEFNKHLGTLKRNKKINTWYDNEILPGNDWDSEIKNQLEQADIIMFCISPDFIDVEKKYIWDVEVEKAIELQNRKGTIIIPIILRFCDWYETPFGKLNALPKKGKPVSSWEDKDEAWFNVVQEMERLIESLV